MTANQIYIPLPLINLKSTAITANTSKTWINPVALYANTPINQPIKRITAIKYNRELMVIGIWLNFYLLE